jgi:DNA invertase Pin-like site-specific DNA recombinase
MKAGIYGRVSTVDKQDVTMQTSELRAYAQARQWEVAGEYVDKLTGASESRPALNRMLADARARKLDAIVIWKLDRLFRDLRHMVNMVAELQALGVALVSVRDNLDLSTPSGRLQFHIISAMAEFEKSLIVERVRAGVRHARAKGKVLGRPRLVIDAAKIAELRRANLSWTAIAKELRQTVAACRRACARYEQTALPKSLPGGQQICAASAMVN